MKLVRYVWWPLVLVTSVAAWWALAYWLEPRPLWVIPEVDTLELMQYDAIQERLLGMRLLNDSRQIVILDAKTGMVLKEITVPVGNYIPERYDYIDQHFHLIESSVWWLHQINNADDSVTIQLKEWKWTTETTTHTRHQWKVGLELESDVNSIQYLPLRFCWSPNTSKLLLVYHVLPTSRIMQKLMQAFNPSSTFDIRQRFDEYHNTLLHCNVWQWQPSSASFAMVNGYSLPVTEMADWRASESWSPDDTRFFQHDWTKPTNSTIREFDTLTGKQGHKLDISQSQHHRSQHLSNSRELLMLQRCHAAEKREDGRLVYHMQQGPIKGGNLTWTLDEWRPLLNIKTWEPVAWPASLNQGIVASDLFQVDARDSTRYLFCSKDYEGNPFRTPTNDKYPPLECYFLRYSDGALSVEHQMQVRNIINCKHGVLCGQLFVQGSQGFEDSDRFISLIQKVPWLYRWYWEKWVKLNGSYVAEVDTTSGNKRWKKSERCISGHLPLLGKDRLLLRFQRLFSPNPTGYECYALPMQFYSPFWPPGVAAVILLVAICYSLRHRQSSTLPTGSPA